MKKLGQEPAFPEKYEYGDIGQFIGYQEGMSKRFYAACAAMQGILASSGVKESTMESIISDSYQLADQLLEQEDL